MRKQLRAEERKYIMDVARQMLYHSVGQQRAKFWETMSIVQTGSIRDLDPDLANEEIVFFMAGQVRKNRELGEVALQSLIIDHSPVVMDQVKKWGSSPSVWERGRSVWILVARLRISELRSAPRASTLTPSRGSR